VSAVARASARRWGWHQLADDWAHRLVEQAKVARGDLVVDVGAGHGALTMPLVTAGARVIAVEIHPDRLAALRARFAGHPVVVVRADAAALRLPRRPFHVVANPPFSAASALIRRLLAPGSRLVDAHLVLPAPVARRWASGRAPGAGRWMAAFRLDVVAHLPRGAFRPAAPCPIAVLQIRRR
jgi:23S rRNA (adenine-N6)-dimethyltransferase